jgi:hypothetical protein
VGNLKIFFVFRKKFVALLQLLVHDNERIGEVKLPSDSPNQPTKNNANSKRQFADHRDGAA